MSLQHKNVTSVQGEYLCLHCGKSWDVTDRDPPPCEVESASTLRVAMKQTGLVANGVVREMADRFAGVPVPTSNVAFLVYESTDPDAPTTLVYAVDRAAARRYVGALTEGTGVLFDVRRLKAMDAFAYGAAPYFEMNPLKIKLANNAARRKVLSFLKFKEAWA